MKKTSLLVAAILVATPALADDVGPYISLGAGVNFGDHDPIRLSPGKTRLETELGFGVIGAFGYDWGDNMRSELELGFHGTDFEDTGFGPAAGDVTAFSTMLNMYYDFQTNSKFEPYLGAGLGALWTDYDLRSGGLTINDKDTSFMVQGMAGIAYRVSDNTDIDVSYRHRRGINNSYSAMLSGVDKVVDHDYRSQGIYAGIRVRFGDRSAPVRRTAAAAPAPMTEAKDDFNIIVYFEWDSSALTGAASTLIREAADYSQSNGASILLVDGHTDTSGSDAYNAGLSERRATIVRNALVQNGISGSMIRTASHGESRTAVSSGDGIREPLNRRAEIVIKFN